MIFGNRLLTESYVTFGADKVWIFPATINLEIQRAAIISCLRDVTPVGASARLHRYFQSLRVYGIESRVGGIVTIQTAQVRMLAGFVTKCAGRNSPDPAVEHRFVRAHLRRQFCIEIDFQLHRADELMAHLAVLRFRRNS